MTSGVGVRIEPFPVPHVKTSMQSSTLIPCLALLALPSFALAQTPYFPAPVAGSTWEITDPATLGWCPERIDSLYAYLGDHHTKGFILLKDGRIVLEHYFGTFTQDSLWYWASAGKTLTSTIVGIAQEDGSLDINEPVSTYLGPGWTAETPIQEAAITVRHQLTMTTGLDDGVANSDCTDPACLAYIADAGDRWAYHNAPYTLLQEVVANATGQNYYTYFNARLRDPIGMEGFWLPILYNRVYFSTVRSMARFGLLASNGMVWGTDTILHDSAYFHAAITPSQNLNHSYGYLWWLNGQDSFMLPSSQFVFPGELVPHAPADMYSALGKNDQIINVAPGQGLVLVRMGDPAYDAQLVSSVFDDHVWQYVNALDCNTGIDEVGLQQGPVLAPNPCKDVVRFQLPNKVRSAEVTLFDTMGRTVLTTRSTGTIDVSMLAPGSYAVRIISDGKTWTSALKKE